jgi:hypothetical protein
MPYTIVVHLPNEDPVCGEVDQLPAANDSIVTVHHPRRRDGKDVHYLSNEVITVIWPIIQISFIEVMPSEGEEKIIGFVRE